MKWLLRMGEALRTVEIEGEGPNLRVALDGEPVAVELLEGDQGGLSLLLEGRAHFVDFDRKGDRLRAYLADSIFEAEVIDERRARRALAAGGLLDSGAQVLVAPMPGKVVRVLVKVGQAVQTGEGLVVVEAMKMENELRASRPGTVKELLVSEGAAVEGGTKLCVVE